MGVRAALSRKTRQAFVFLAREIAFFLAGGFLFAVAFFFALAFLDAAPLPLAARFSFATSFFKASTSLFRATPAHLTLIAKSSKHENAKQPHWAQARSSCWGTRSPPL